MDSFPVYIRKLRKASGLTLKQVEKRAGVSNAYISQFERGLRKPPHPDVLQRLAKVYGVPQQDLLVAAGYLDDPEQKIERDQLEKAFQHVLTDPKYRYGNRLRGAKLTLDVKRFIVEMYQDQTGRKLLQES